MGFETCRGGELLLYKPPSNILLSFWTANEAIPVHDLKTIAQLENFRLIKISNTTCGQLPTATISISNSFKTLLEGQHLLPMHIPNRTRRTSFHIFISSLSLSLSLVFGREGLDLAKSLPNFA